MCQKFRGPKRLPGRGGAAGQRSCVVVSLSISEFLVCGLAGGSLHVNRFYRGIVWNYDGGLNQPRQVLYSVADGKLQPSPTALVGC